MVEKLTSGIASDAINKSFVLHVNTADAKTDKAGGNCNHTVATEALATSRDMICSENDLLSTKNKSF